MSLELDLQEWARWARQGCQYGAGYPCESSTEGLAIPFRRAGTTDEQLEDFMASRAADERIGARIELWVRQIHEPMRTALRVYYVDMPESERWSNLSADEWQERRVRHTARLLSKRPGSLAISLTRDQYDAAMSLAMALLGDLEQRWVRGV